MKVFLKLKKNKEVLIYKQFLVEETNNNYNKAAKEVKNKHNVIVKLK